MNWSEATIRTACASADLTRMHITGLSPSGSRCGLYELGLETVRTTGEVL